MDTLDSLLSHPIPRPRPPVSYWLYQQNPARVHARVHPAVTTLIPGTPISYLGNQQPPDMSPHFHPRHTPIPFILSPTQQLLGENCVLNLQTVKP